MINNIEVETEYPIGTKVKSSDGSILQIVRQRSMDYDNCYINKIRSQFAPSNLPCFKRFKCRNDERVDNAMVEFRKVGEVKENYIKEDFPINSEFIIEDGSILRVLPGTKCSECYIRIKLNNQTPCSSFTVPCCISGTRKDEQSVYFKKVGDIC